jgi:hypothetical protein
MEFSLPKEMWSKIWSDLDFETLQKTCVLVCQGWFENIRGNGQLSGQLSLNNAGMEKEEAKAVLSKWKELRILQLSKNLDQVDLSKTHKFLKKVIVPNVPEGYQNMFPDFLEDPDYPGSVNKICFSPQDKSNSIGLDNITEFALHFEELEAIEESEKLFEPMGVMKNLIRLEIIFGEGDLETGDFDFESNFEPLFQGIGFSSDLEEVRLDAKGDYFQICGDLILRYLSQITRLEVVGVHQGDFNGSVDFNDLLWIPKLKKMKTLILSDLNIFSDPDDPFYKTPMANVNELELCGSVVREVTIVSVSTWYTSTEENSTFLIKLSENFPALHTLKITDGQRQCNDNKWICDISLLESVLNALGSMKNLRISAMQCELKITYGFDKPMVKRAMQEALEIIEKKFPIDLTEIEIYAVLKHISNKVETGYSPAKPTDGYRFSIIKEKGKGPSLKIMEIEPIPPK